MIRVKILPKNEVSIIDNGKSYLFNMSGVCYKEDAGLLPRYVDGMLELPIISVLSSSNEVEIAVINNAGVEMRRFSTQADAMTCALALQRKGNFIRMLRRDGKQNDIRFNQLLFVYREGTILDGFLNDLGVKEVFS